MADSVVLIQFAKRPIAGLVKTRLIPALGADAARQTHEALLRQTLDTLVNSRLGRVELWWDADWDDDDYLRTLMGSSQPDATAVQHGLDLGARMYQALNRGLEQAPKVLLVGSDCPVLSRDYLVSVVEALDSADIVLGPSDDGGFVLIGARRLVPDCLSGVEWGTGAVLEQTLIRMHAAGLVCHLAETLWDVDEPEDYRRWQALSVRGQETTGLKTAAFKKG